MSAPTPTRCCAPCSTASRPVRQHGTGDPTRQNMGGRDRQAERISGADCRSGDKFRGSTLPVREMALADLFANRHHNALPADHGAETERDRNRHLHPDGNELGRSINHPAISRQRRRVLRGKCRLLSQSNRLADEVHVVAHVRHGGGRDGAHRAACTDLCGNIAGEGAERRPGLRVGDLAGLYGMGHDDARRIDRGRRRAVRVRGEDRLRPVGRLIERRSRASRHSVVQRERGRHRADQNSIMSPMPFCPSFDPCANDTPVQVRISRPRIHAGGGRSEVGAA